MSPSEVTYLAVQAVSPGKLELASPIETPPLEKTPEADAKMMAGKARPRMVPAMQP